MEKGLQGPGEAGKKPDSHQQLGDIIEFLPDATFVIDSYKRVIFWNRAIEEMTGVKKEAILGRADHAYALALYGTPRPTLVDLLFSGDGAVENLYEYVDKKGETLYAEFYSTRVYGGRGAHLWVKASPLLGSDGKIAGAIESVRDITDRKKDREALSRELEINSALAYLSGKLLTTTDIVEISSFVLECVKDLTESESGCVAYTDPLTGRLISPTTTQDTRGEKCRRRIPEARAPIDGLLSVPAVIGGKQVGQISVANSSRDYAEADRELAERFAALFAVAVQRIHDEAAIKKSEIKFRNLFDKANDAIFLSSLTGNGTPGCFMEVNDIACSRLGYSRKELFKMSPADIVPKENAKKTSDILKELLSRDRVTFETTHISRDGRNIPVEINSHVFMLDESRVVLSVARDITERKLAEKKLRESEEKYRNVFDNAPLGISHFDSRGIITAVNDNFTKIIGSAREEMIGFDLSTLPNQEVVAAVKESLAGNLGVYEGEYQSFTAPKATPLKANFAPIAINGAVVGGMGIVEDITERKVAESDLRAANEELEATVEELNAAEEELRQQYAELQKAKEAAEAASRTKGEFLANMSHEIRTPMNSIMGITELMLGMPLEEDLREMVDTVRDSSGALLNIINDILDFSKIEAGKMTVQKVNFDIYSLIDSIAETMALKAREKSILLSTYVDPDIPSLVQGDPWRIRQVLLNLAGNAVKFTDQGEVAIRATTECQGENTVVLRFEVRDSGIGLPEEYYSKIFDPFSQVDGSVTREYGGTGLGLSVSRQLVDLMGGAIGVESQVDRGSVFWFTIPLENVAVPGKMLTGDLGKSHWQEDASSPPVSPPAGETLILLAEDNPVNRKLTMRQLEKLGYAAHAVSNGREAVEAALGKESYSLVLMDCQMPEMDGLEATRAIRRAESPQGRHIPVIAVTAHAMKGDRDQCIAVGMDDYLSKPVTLQQLKQVLARWLAAAVPTGGGLPSLPPEAKNEAGIIDENVLESLREIQANGERDLVGELIGIYLADTPPRLTDLKRAIEKGDSDLLQFTAHSIKSSSTSVGAVRLSAMAGELEAMGRSGVAAGAGEKLKSLEAEYEKVVAVLKGLPRQQ